MAGLREQPGDLHSMLLGEFPHEPGILDVAVLADGGVADEDDAGDPVLHTPVEDGGQGSVDSLGHVVSVVTNTGETKSPVFVIQVTRLNAEVEVGVGREVG